MVDFWISLDKLKTYSRSNLSISTAKKFQTLDHPFRKIIQYTVASATMPTNNFTVYCFLELISKLCATAPNFLQGIGGLIFFSTEFLKGVKGYQNSRNFRSLSTRGFGCIPEWILSKGLYGTQTNPQYIQTKLTTLINFSSHFILLKPFEGIFGEWQCKN